jgi:hypothetical protein
MLLAIGKDCGYPVTLQKVIICGCRSALGSQREPRSVAAALAACSVVAVACIG